MMVDLGKAAVTTNRDGGPEEAREGSLRRGWGFGSVGWLTRTGGLSRSRE
jgi:hypothetical protein